MLLPLLFLANLFPLKPPTILKAKQNKAALFRTLHVMKAYLFSLASSGEIPLNICILYEQYSLRMSYLRFFSFHKNGIRGIN